LFGRGAPDVMDSLASIFGIVGWWIALSLLLWWLHRSRNRRRLNRKITHAGQVRAQTLAAQAVFDKIRGAAFKYGIIRNEDELERETFALLRRIQETQAFFDNLTALSAQVRLSMKCDDCPPLTELMHIRRDLWAASEIVLMEDLHLFGGEVDEADGEDANANMNLEQLRLDAASVLFKGVEDDPIDLRLSIARDEAERFAVSVDEEINKSREADRMPSFGEIMSYPIIVIRAIPRYALAFAAYVVKFARYVRALAKRLRESEAYARGVYELRRARETLPGRIAEGASKASAAARQGAAAARHGASVLHRHYTFLKEAHNLQARYEQLLSGRSEISERGRQFFVRLEAAARSEHLRLSWTNAIGWLKRRIVWGLAFCFGALERLKEYIDAINADIMRKAKELAAVRRLALPAPPEERDGKRTAPMVFLNPVTREIATKLMDRLARAQVAAEMASLIDSDEKLENVKALAPEDDDVPQNQFHNDDLDDDIDEPGPLTRSVLEVQAKIAAESQEEGVPWLRR
jgi:hypothetical protein